MEQGRSKRQRDDPGSSTDLPFKRIRPNLVPAAATEKDPGDRSSTDDFTSSAGSPSSSPSSSSALSSSDSGSDRDDDSISQEGLEDEAQGSYCRLNGSSLTSVPAPVRPQIRPINDSKLLSEVSSFLPKLKAANREIQKDIAAGKAVILDNGDADGQYIEMVCAFVPMDGILGLLRSPDD